MDIGPVHVGPSEAVVAVLLGLLVAIVLISLVVIVLWGIALLVVAPTLTTITTRVRRRRQHNWLRDQWLVRPQDAAPPDPLRPQRPPVCGVSVVCHRDAGAHLDFVAAQLSSPDADHSSEPASMGMVHAAVTPSSRLNLLPHSDCNVAVLVLTGQGTAGVERRPVRAGQVAVFGPEAPVTITADSQAQVAPLEVLVLSQPETDEPASRGEVTVVDRSPAVQRRLAELKLLVERPLPSDVANDAALVDDAAAPEGGTAPEQGTAPDEVAARDEVAVPDEAAPAA